MLKSSCNSLAVQKALTKSSFGLFSQSWLSSSSSCSSVSSGKAKSANGAEDGTGAPELTLSKNVRDFVNFCHLGNKRAQIICKNSF